MNAEWHRRRPVPAWIEPHKRLFIGPLADSDKWEVQLQIVRVLPLFEWTATEMRRVHQILLRGVEHPQKFVRAWARWTAWLRWLRETLR